MLDPEGESIQNGHPATKSTVKIFVLEETVKMVLLDNKNRLFSAIMEKTVHCSPLSSPRSYQDTR